MSLGLEEALRLMLEAIEPLPAENVSLLESVDRVAASDLYALVDSPSSDVSRKDGYAVFFSEVKDATAANPVRLRPIGSAAAGSAKTMILEPGTTVRVLTGARIPSGADAVVAEECTRSEQGEVLVEAAPVEPDKNILARGSDVHTGRRLLEAGRRVSPATAGYLAAAGISKVPLFSSPVVGIVGTGDEIVEPGAPLAEDRIYASNIVTLAGWCGRSGMRSLKGIVKDDFDSILSVFKKMSAATDAMITSGGAWKGDRDMVADVLDRMGWKKIFHRIRMGPGKAVGFGILDGKPVFILPGGPPSNLIAFLQIALPGLMRLCGHASPGLPRINATLASGIGDGKVGWTDLFFGTIEQGEGLPIFHPMKKRSRLGSIAEATALASVPEDKDHLSEGSVISVQLLT
ncbi:MAG: molybdopterin molybdotransferase MoeA [Syntrophorhabdaceae bacterium]|nr:molybdopterin molybdotransferase MoeA [Syntrophorhabdaceae bacterium]